MPDPTPPKAPRATASSTGRPTKPPTDPMIGTYIGVGAIAVSIGGREYNVDPDTGTITGRRV